jgi:hypothetical protein
MKRSLIKLVSLATVVLMAVSCKDKKDGPDYKLLDPWKGTYTVTALSYYGASQVPPTTSDDMTWTVVVAQVDTSETMLSFTGIGGNNANTVYATLDPVALTISFKSGQNLGDLFSYGDVSLYYASSDIVAHINSDIEATYIDAAATVNITGTLQTSGAIAIDKMAEVVQGPFVWDVFNTTWVKNTK